MPQKKAIHLEQVKLLYRNLRVVILGSMFVLSAVLWAAWEEKSSLHLLLLAGFMCTILLLRHVDGLRFQKALESSDISPIYWERRFILGIFSSGVLWGTTFLLIFSPERPDIVLFVVCFYSGLISSASATTAARLPAFLALIVPATLPIVVQILLAGGALYFAMGIAFMVFVLANIVVASTYSRIIRDSICLRFENLALISRLEEEKNRAEHNQQIAEQAMIAKDKFLAAASHDLRQPLHAQGLYLDAIETHVQSTRGVEHLEALRKTNEALTTLFNSLLDVSRLNAGIVEVHNYHVCLNSIMYPLHEEFKSQATENKITLTLGCKNLTVFTDAVLLTRVLRNLLSNAIRYTPKDGKISISSHQLDNDTVQISVRDTGIGIPETEQQNIFAEYYQLENPERDRSKGLGLGLAIVKKLCALMDLSITCQSTVGKGATFILSLPSGDNDLVCQSELISHTPAIAGIHVLVIDDEYDVLDSMRCMLDNWGCITTTAESTEDALNKITQDVHKPDIIITDYRLREGKTGAQAIAAVRQKVGENIPAMLITGDTSTERLQNANASGLYLLHKPVSPAKLRSVMNQLVSMSRK